MPHADLVARGAQVMTVCNACRYCEQYCPVFPAMERRLTFAQADLAYLANLCHNCGECLYACQYAPPHEFAINVPMTLAQIRLSSYEDYCWPRALAGAFARQGMGTALLLAAFFTALLVLATVLVNPAALWPVNASADFYAVMSHDVMVAVFGGVSVFVIIALAVGVVRFWRDVTRGHATGSRASGRATLRAVHDALTLRHLHPGSIDCVSAEEDRQPWRRWCHHFTFYGFALCFASTTIAATYHGAFGWTAPYAYTSLPVSLGTLGGIGLTIGSCGLFLLRRDRDPALGGATHEGLDRAFLTLLLLTALTGLALLLLRHQPVMSALLHVHLGIVLALFVTLPYGKFVHGLYRLAALVLNAQGR